MPWCEPCEQFYNPNTLTSGGNCPTCGVLVGEIDETAKPEAVKLEAKKPVVEPATKVPWHFWLLCIATAGYLIWRFVQLGFRIF